MKTIISELTPILAMVIIAVILVTCIAHDIDHGIIYGGITAISGLGGYALGRFHTEKIYEAKQKSSTKG